MKLTSTQLLHIYECELYSVQADSPSKLTPYCPLIDTEFIQISVYLSFKIEYLKMTLIPTTYLSNVVLSCGE